MQITDRQQGLTITPIWRLAFRPFFLFGMGFAALAVPLWVLALNGYLADFTPASGWLNWHQHELIFGFALAIISGFLLTAVQAWTGQPSLSGQPLLSLFAIWLVARGAWLLNAPLVWLVALDSLFMLALLLQMSLLLISAKQRRNYPVLLILLLLLAANSSFMWGISHDQPALVQQSSYAGLWLIAAMITLIGGRVIPFFTQRGLALTQALPRSAGLDNALLILTLGLGLLYLSGIAAVLGRYLALIWLLLAVGHGYRLARWYRSAIWRVPLLWSLQLAYGWLVIACGLFALWQVGWMASPSSAVHAFTVGAMSNMILAMVARVSLGHTGRPLQLGRLTLVSLVLFNLAVIARVLVIHWDYAIGLWLASALWLLALGLWFIQYLPILTRARVDGHPG